MIRKALVSLTVLAAVAALGLSACSGGPRPDSLVSKPAAPPTTVAGKPVAQFFGETCTACHGAKRQGIVGPALTPARLKQDDSFYADTIKRGRPGTAMPSFSFLSDDDIKALVQFVKYTEPK